ncbi:MAG: hypothetical protein Q9223_006584, partial [Gallowayella weberi]
MHISPSLIAFAAATLYASSMASPVDPIRVGRPAVGASSQTLNCKDPKTGIAQQCWNELKVGQYMKNWYKLNFPKTCKKGDDFSTCFGNLAVSGSK